MADMDNSKTVPTGPQGTAVRPSPDGKAPVVSAGTNPSPLDNTPPASDGPVGATRDGLDTDKDGNAKYGKGAGTKLRFERDYWPKTQPEDDGKDHRVKAGEAAYLPNDEAMDCIEAGIAKRVKD